MALFHQIQYKYPTGQSEITDIHANEGVHFHVLDMHQKVTFGSRVHIWRFESGLKYSFSLQKGLTPQDPLYFFNGQIHRVTKFFGTFRPTEYDSEKKLGRNRDFSTGKWI